MLIHATSVAINGKAVLLAGPAGIGKSDLALRLIDNGGQLIADDQTFLEVVGSEIMASSPPSIAGFLEIRHLGLIKMPFLARASVKLYVELCSADENLPRLPEKDIFFLLDHPVERLRLPAFLASTSAKIRAALFYPRVTDQ